MFLLHIEVCLCPSLSLFLHLSQVNKNKSSGEELKKNRIIVIANMLGKNVIW